MTRDLSHRTSRPARRLTALLVAVSTTGIWFGTGGPVEAAPTQAAAAEHAAVPGELLVGYRVGATSEQRANARSRAAAQLQDRVVKAEGARAEVELVRIPQGSDRSAAARRLEEDPAVAYAEPNYVMTHAATSNDPKYTDGSLWGMYGDATKCSATDTTNKCTNLFGSQAGEAWTAGKTGSDAVYVGVIDEGIQITHPDLNDNIWTNPYDPRDGVDNDGNGYIDDVNGWDFDGNNNTVYDGGPKGSSDNHGTHVAGTIGAEANGTGVVGVNHNVTLISGKFLGRRGGTTAGAINAVDYFTDLKTRHGLNIVATNNSWGGGGHSQALLDAIARGAHQDILFIAAAGNGGSDGVGDNNDVTASYPSGYSTLNVSALKKTGLQGAGTIEAVPYDAVIAVAAITSDGLKSSFSNYGKNSVDLGAPGSGIWSTTAFNKYSSYSGTSMATPHVSGAAALYMASNQTATTKPSATAIKAAILNGVAATDSISKTATTPTFTGGRLNVSGF